MSLFKSEFLTNLILSLASAYYFLGLETYNACLQWFLVHPKLNWGKRDRERAYSWIWASLLLGFPSEISVISRSNLKFPKCGFYLSSGLVLMTSYFSVPHTGVPYWDIPGPLKFHLHLGIKMYMSPCPALCKSAVCSQCSPLMLYSLARWMTMAMHHMVCKALSSSFLLNVWG